ncbi:NTP transferase domain-containing protein [Stenotrophomonas maltophilia]|jgi:molybdenum cofactor cytidylyltransferase|uniref:nucleotidyltransferase family protein n=1 Tax=Stenotrophomonas TaxID=40323 RepID=UPI000D1A76D0|nr:MULTISPECIES: NTP transferase domain-containing protein [Stenotrophomonas]MBN5019679.1 NTP transferase domain-containing protein [Stenotrophomonas maltophilia]MCU0999673.1 NTP transferase domain-containing protein [Stenotrophomonas maltophilia]
MPAPATATGLTVIVLAAGRGERFLASGATTHKLDALLDDKPVLWHVLRAVESSGLDWHLVRPTGRTAGMGDSIAMGVRATAGAFGWLVLPGDLPLVRATSLQRVARALEDHAIVVPHHRQRPGHPVGFRREYLESLVGLSGDVGAAAIVRACRQHGEVLDLPLSDAGIACDIDSLDDLVHAERLLCARRRRAARDRRASGG